MTTGLGLEPEIGPRDDGGYPVTARASGGGEAAGHIELPLTEQELDQQLITLRQAVLRSSAVFRRLPTADERPAQELGRTLFDALVTGDVRVLFGASYQQARQEGVPLRLVLRIRPPELSRLPWEFLFDATQEDYLGLRMPLVRYPQVLEPRRPLAVNPPLQILGMVARPGDRDDLNVQGEQRRLHEALAALEREGRIELSWVQGQSWRDLQRAIDEGTWHVFHFIGHGGYDQVRDEGVIALTSEDGASSPLGARDLSLLLGEHHHLRLVVLNACNTGRASASDPLSSTAGWLIRRGVPAVVAMQFEISDRAAIEFSRSFYEAVAKPLPVDMSVVRGRQAVNFCVPPNPGMGHARSLSSLARWAHLRVDRRFDTATTTRDWESSQGRSVRGAERGL